MATGITLTGVGVIGLIAGGALFGSAANSIDVYQETPIFDAQGREIGSQVFLSERRDDETMQAGGIAMMVIGGLMVAGGIPLWVIGGKRVPLEQPAQSAPPVGSLRPDVVLGASGGALHWQF